VQAHARKVKVLLTYGRRLNREWRFDGRWYYMTLNCPDHIAVYDPTWSMIPHLVRYLQTFKSLRELEIVVEVYQPVINKVTELRDLDRLLPFFELGGVRIKVRFEMDPCFEVDVPEEIVKVGWMESLSGFLAEQGGAMTVHGSRWKEFGCGVCELNVKS
jgi:hypothetical protein